MNDESGTEALEALIGKEIAELSDGDALAHIGILVDTALDAGSPAATKRAFALLDILEGHDLSGPDAALLHYVRANAWENRRKEKKDHQVWAWEQPEMQAQILELRRAVRHDGFGLLPAIRQCQVLTNLAIQLSSIGRFLEAIALWDRVLAKDANFAMALGNRGIALHSYAVSLYDPGHAALISVAAFDSLNTATASDAVYESAGLEGARCYFEHYRSALAANLDIDSIRERIDVENHSLGESDAERAYRHWCLTERLFVNPLNDLGPIPIAAQDVLTLPSLSAPLDACGMPPAIGFFNQMKQEFVSARYLLYEALHADGPHFSDRGVLLYNTLDYPVHSLSAEKLRAAFRISYSLLDKIGFFLNSYLQIGRKPDRVSFRKIWYEPKGVRPALLACFTAGENWPLRGLFWLSMDLFEEEFQAATELDAEALAVMRNHLEHRYLQLHEGWAGSLAEHEQEAGKGESLRYGLSREAFAARTLRLLQLVRSALIYLSLAVHREEQLHEQVGNGLVAPMPLSTLEDGWKF